MKGKEIIDTFYGNDKSRIEYKMDSVAQEMHWKIVMHMSIELRFCGMSIKNQTKNRGVQFVSLPYC